MTFPLDWLSSRMLGLQGPDRPWTILFGVRLSRPVSVDAIADAWRTTVAVRPELAVLAGAGFTWEPTGPEPPTVGAVEPHLDHAMQVGLDQPVRVVVDDDPATVIRFVVNHAHADGIGVRAMADDLLRALAGERPQPRQAVTDEHLDRLRSRRLEARAALDQIPPRGIATIPAPATAPTRLDIVTVAAEPIARRRRDAGVSVSCLLIEATHRALRESPVVGAGRLALGVPADLRRHVGGPDGIGNAVVNLTYAPSSPPTLAAVDDFLRTDASPDRLGATLAWIHRVGRPRSPRATARTGRSVATVMLSNLGLVPDAPHWERVDMLELVAPAHQTTSVGFIGFRDTLTVTVRSRGDTGDLAASIASGLAG